MTTETRRPFRLIPQGRLRSVLIVAFAVAFLVFVCTWIGGLTNDAEEGALNYIRLHGSTSENYEPGELYFVLSRVLGSNARFLCSRRLTICMEPRDFTDNTINELMVVRNLDRILLYEKNTKAGTRLAVVPLEQAETSATRQGIARFQQRFPNVKIQVVQQGDGSLQRDTAMPSPPRGRTRSRQDN